VRILGISGSLRAGSHNTQLLRLAAEELPEGVELELYEDLAAIPPFDQDLVEVAPDEVEQLKEAVAASDAILVATPEFNGSIPGQLKNALDWVSRVRERGDPTYAAFKGRVFAIASASPGRAGGLRSLMALRQILELGCGALVIPEQVAIQRADNAFDEMDNIADTGLANLFRAQLERLVEIGRIVLGAFEHQVLEEVRETGLARLLVLRADVVPEVHGHHRQLMIFVHDDIEAVVERALREGDLHR